jgi:hypothetical protein
MVSTAQTWSDERCVQVLDVVRGHEKKPALLAGHSVNSVEQTREGDARIAVGCFHLPLEEHCVHVLEQ